MATFQASSLSEHRPEPLRAVLCGVRRGSAGRVCRGDQRAGPAGRSLSRASRRLPARLSGSGNRQRALRICRQPVCDPQKIFLADVPSGHDSSSTAVAELDLRLPSCLRGPTLARRLGTTGERRSARGQFSLRRPTPRGRSSPIRRLACGSCLITVVTTSLSQSDHHEQSVRSSPQFRRTGRARQHAGHSFDRSRSARRMADPRCVSKTHRDAAGRHCYQSQHEEQRGDGRGPLPGEHERPKHQESQRTAVSTHSHLRQRECPHQLFRRGTTTPTRCYR